MLSGYILATKACIDNRGKNLLNSNISSTCPHSISTGFASRLGFVAAPTSLNGGPPTLHDVWPSPGLGTIFRGPLLPNGILSVATFTLRPSLAFSYIGCVTARARHSSSGRQPNFAAAWYKEWNYGTFAPRHFRSREQKPSKNGKIKTNVFDYTSFCDHNCQASYTSAF